MNKILPLLTLILLYGCCNQLNDEDFKTDIRNSMDAQIESWNSGDLEGFMQPYWKSDSMRFIGKSGVNKGWETTLNNYKRGYPDKATMGTLEFDILSIEKISDDHAMVIGKWTIFRSDTVSGHYSLIWKKIEGAWKIILDHSS
jgi:hypothetical protein